MHMHMCCFIYIFVYAIISINAIIGIGTATCSRVGAWAWETEYICIGLPSQHILSQFLAASEIWSDYCGVGWVEIWQFFFWITHVEAAKCQQSLDLINCNSHGVQESLFDTFFFGTNPSWRWGVMQVWWIMTGKEWEVKRELWTNWEFWQIKETSPTIH